MVSRFRELLPALVFSLISIIPIKAGGIDCWLAPLDYRNKSANGFLIRSRISASPVTDGITMAAGSIRGLPLFIPSVISNSADRPGILSGVNAEKSITGDGSIAYLIRSTNTKLRAHIGSGFRAASLFERFGTGTFQRVGLRRFGDPTLRAEQSISVDGGVDQRRAHDRVLLGVTYFYTRLQRVIDFQSSFVVDARARSF